MKSTKITSEIRMGNLIFIEMPSPLTLSNLQPQSYSVFPYYSIPKSKQFISILSHLFILPDLEEEQPN